MSSRRRHPPTIAVGLLMLGAIGLGLTFSTSSVPLIYAQGPQLPVVYSGNVMLNGGPAPDGLNITAWDNGQIVGFLSVGELTSGGEYSLQVCGHVGETCNTGDVISFKLNNPQQPTTYLVASQTSILDLNLRGCAPNPCPSLDLSFTGQIITTSTTSSSTTSSAASSTTTSSLTSSTTSSSTTTSQESTTSTTSEVSSTTEATSSTTSAVATTRPPGPCIIATATYGSSMAPEVVYMRYVRDNMIGSTPIGRRLVNAFNVFYYSWSPPLAGAISESGSLQALFRVLILPVVAIVHLTGLIFTTVMTVAASRDLASTVAFVSASLLTLATYVALPTLAVVELKRVASARRPARN